MSEQGNSEIEGLLNPNSEESQQERGLIEKGFIPERWLQIEAAETQRMSAGLESALQDRKKDWKEAEIPQRQATVRRYFGELMLPPSFQDGPYAANQWLNLYEMLPRIIDMKQDESIVPDVDGRVPFSSLGLEKGMIIKHWLIDRVQGALPKNQQLTDAHLRDCFTNVTEQQLTAVIDQIAQSGLTLKPESPKEHWARIVAGSKPQK